MLVLETISIKVVMEMGKAPNFWAKSAKVRRVIRVLDTVLDTRFPSEYYT